MKWSVIKSDTAETQQQTPSEVTSLTLRRFGRHASQKGLLALLLGSVATGIICIPEYALAETKVIKIPKHARLQSLESLRLAVKQDGGVPSPKNLDDFIKDRKAALQLGKALFWDMQVGSDGVQACASCHFHAGADNRTKNALNPALRIIFDHHDGDVEGYFNADFANSFFRFETQQPNEPLIRKDFPFIKSIQDLNRTPDGVVEPGYTNSNDITGSMGMFATQFGGVEFGSPIDLGTSQPDLVFNVDGQTTLRRVEPRNTPTVINAVFNFTNFWDGRASNIFNGRGTFGDQDRNVTILVNRPKQGVPTKNPVFVEYIDIFIAAVVASTV